MNPIKSTTLSPHVQIEQFHLHIKCSPNNTIVTLTKPDGCPVKEGWWSGGLCGFKGVNRSGYEAGYQCAVRAFSRIEEVSEENPGLRIEILFKGFGQGRDAVYKALLTSEGEKVRPLINRMTDNTPIKIGGTRAKKMRRL